MCDSLSIDQQHRRFIICKLTTMSIRATCYIFYYRNKAWKNQELRLSLSSNLTWKTHIHSLAKQASQKLGFLARARGYFSSSHLLTIYNSQIHPSLEHCSHVWGDAPNSLSVFLTKSSPKPFVSSTIPTSQNLSNHFPIVE